MLSKDTHSIAIFGSGPSGLMAATQLIQAGVKVDLYERRPSYGRKLLIAGSSGLNISHDGSMDEWANYFQGFSPEVWKRFFSIYSREDWLHFIESLGFETFLGTSSRYFVREMKASNLLKRWIETLKQRGVRFFPQHEWESASELQAYSASGFFLGGGSWEESPPAWPDRFRKEFGLKVHDFYPTNVGFEVAWSDDFLKEAEGKPFKNIVLTNARGQKAGELVVTKYGLEGTPIYFLGQPGEAFLDLKPALSIEAVRSKLESIKENLSPIRRIKKALNLNETALALLFHHTSKSDHGDLEVMLQRIKAFPVTLLRARPLLEAISSGGGVDLSEVSIDPGNELMLKRHPGIFCGGEMLNWQAPTGGFLIQASVTQGAVAARSMIQYLKHL